MSLDLTCPFCNSLLPRVDAGRTTCPRCGESITPRRLGPQSSSLDEPFPSASQVRPKSSSRWLVFIVGLAVLALGVGIAADQWLNHNESSSIPPNEPARAVIPPAELPGIGYLPESTEVVLAIQLPALMEKFDPDERDDPTRALANMGLPETVIETMEKASGVGLKNVNELVVGMGFEKGSFPPQIVVVVHTRRPYDMAAVARDAKARQLKRDGRTLHVVKASPVPEIYWWGPNDRVLVATLLARDFADVPVEPRTGIGHLRPQVADLIRDRVPGDSAAWLVAYSDQWGDHIRPYTFLPFTPLKGRTDLIAPAERLRSIAIAIPQPSVRPAEVQIELKSAAAGEELRTTFARRFHGEKVEITGDGENCRLTTPFDPEQFGIFVARLVGPAR
jgi:hypothetical protein